MFAYHWPHYGIYVYRINNGIGKQHYNPLIQQQSMCCISIEQKIKHIHYNVSYGHFSKRITALRVMEFTILVDPSLVIISIKLRLSNPCPSVDKKKREEIYSSISLYGHAPAQVRNFGRLFLGHHNLVCLIYAWEQRRRFLKK